MDLKKLQVFQLVYSTRSVSRAAEIPHITQPAVSMRLSQLEAGLGFQLFERRKGRLFPTAEGTEMFRRAGKLLASMTELEHWATRIDRAVEGDLRIATLYGPAFELLPTILSRFAAEFPRVAVSLTADTSPTILDQIASGDFDCGIGEYTYQHTEIWSLRVPQACSCVLPKGHRLASQSAITAIDLDGVPLITLPHWHRTNHEIERHFRDAGVTRLPLYEVDVWGIAMNMVAKGLGVTIADPINIHAFRHLDLDVRPYEPTVSFDLALKFPADRPRSKLAARFAELFAETVDALPGLSAPTGFGRPDC